MACEKIKKNQKEMAKGGEVFKGEKVKERRKRSNGVEGVKGVEGRKEECEGRVSKDSPERKRKAGLSVCIYGG